MTIRDALANAARYLEAHGVETPRLDAELLLAHALGRSRTALHLERERELEPEEEAWFRELLERRGGREPVAYVLGEWGFRRLTLKVDPRALIPRPETEVVVERCLELLRDASRPRVLDVGAGSGAIALALLDEHRGARVTAVDTSLEALALAQENAERLGLDLDLRFGGLEVAAEGWDLVVSNPPYVAAHEYDTLQPEIRHWEPRGALVGDGVHEELARRARTRWLVLEVGDGQAQTVARSLCALGYADVHVSADLAGRERVVEGRRP